MMLETVNLSLGTSLTGSVERVSDENSH